MTDDAAVLERLSSVERAVRRQMDKDEIVDLVHRYSYFVDHFLHDQVAELFTEDCVVDYGRRIGWVVRGRPAVPRDVRARRGIQ